MTITHATLQSEPTKPNLDRIITYLHQPIWARRFITGLVPSNDVDAGGDDLIFTAGVAADLSGEKLMELGSSMTKLMDTAWSEGTGGGALDTGAVADTTYHVYLIRNPNSKKVDILSSTSASAPTMPTGYSQKRRIFSFRRASGVNQVFTAVEISGGGLLVQIAPAVDFSKDWTGTDDAAQTGTSTIIPAGVQMMGRWAVTFGDNGPAARSSFLLSSFDVADVAPVTGANPFTTSIGQIRLAIDAAEPATNSAEIEAMTRATDAAVRFRATGTTADHGMAAALLGWTDFRVS